MSPARRPLAFRVVLTILVATAAAAGRPLAQRTDVMQTLLQKAGDYHRQFRRDVAGIVLEEDYLQTAKTAVILARQLRSDYTVIADDAVGWIEFRDVYEIDGKPVRDREDRVIALFATPSGNAVQQARRIVAESARHNLIPVGLRFDRTLNVPMAAQTFLAAENQHRSAYRLDGGDRVRGHRVSVLRFQETSTPRLIGSPDNAPAEGTFWVEPDTGKILRTLLILRSRRGANEIAASVRVDYSEQPRYGLWLPSEMEEQYLVSTTAGQSIAEILGRAVYTNARKFSVVTDEKVAPEN